VSSDAGVEHYEAWGGYGASKAALDHLTLTLGTEVPGIRAYALDPGDMRTAMHQAAFPGEDISDRPLTSEVAVPGILALAVHPSRWSLGALLLTWAAKCALDLTATRLFRSEPLPLKVLWANAVAPLGLVQVALPLLAPGAVIINVTSDAATEAYEGWGGYGASKAALEQLSAVLAVERPELRVYTVDPGDMRTRMHQDAFPGEDISDRPEPEERIPGLITLIESDAPSGRYRAADLAGTAA